MLWNLDKLLHPPKTHSALDFIEEGVRSLFYDGMPWRGRNTRIFAWYGTPERQKGEKVPAMVLVHGGGGSAFAHWVRLWNSRGYAAIAMDLCGCVPRQADGGWLRHDLGGPPGWGGFDQIDESPEDQWTYHAVSGAILGHSLLRSFPEIDVDRIGLTGISWGGYLTCILSGIDDRFRFAAPVYGCGYLGENSAWLPNFAAMGEAKAGKWLKLWDPSRYLGNATMPMLWVTGTNDGAYPMDSLQKSYRLPEGDRVLSIRVRMPHNHTAGEMPDEIHTFANSILQGGTPFAKIHSYGMDGDSLWAKFDSILPVVQAELNYTTDRGDWTQREWLSAPAKLDHRSRCASAVLPPNTTVCYLNLMDGKGSVVSTEHVESSGTEGS